MTTKTKPASKTSRRPKIVLCQDTLDRLESMAEGAFQRNPAMADRLLEELGRAQIVAPGKMPANVVAIGNDVTYRDEATGIEKTVRLVFPEDADIAAQRISVMTPMGVALLGLTEGAAFYWDTRDDQRRTLTVMRVSPARTDGDEG
ncbi:nucleoside diphosphate kinase regulator [Phaeovulum sp.]|uniref:nucleoside diphosphate kinase regulator n=1 Tax=Phaeovulum sp. TaxID=2934796 RepID=UPI0039E6A28D